MTTNSIDERRCVFCAIVSGQSPASLVYEDDVSLALMDIRQADPGHVLVIPRTHYPHLADLPEETGAHLFTVGQRVAAAIRRSGLRSEGMNLFLTDGEGFQEVYHAHLHVWPRFEGDLFARMIGPGWHKWRGRIVTREELDRLAEQIRAGL